ncbi:MAG: isochorismatase family protein, partial [Methylophagaceae bacterium]
AEVDEFMSSLRASHRRQVILTGMEAHICVLQTALALLAQGFEVFVVEDAICSRTQQNQDNALQRLRQAGVIITNTESVLFEWLSDAKHPKFRTLSKLIV